MVSSPERLATVMLLTLALVAVPVSLWRHGVLGPGLPFTAGDLTRPRPGVAEDAGSPSSGTAAEDGAGSGTGAAAGGAFSPERLAVGAGEEHDGPPGEAQHGLPGEAQRTGPVVHVVGAVRNPGVYALPAGARVCDAIRAAGGERDDGASWALNLAARVLDGDRVYVPTGQEVAAGEGTRLWQPQTEVGAGGAAPGRPVDINHASAQELEAVPGIGPALARRIVAFRQANGRFACVDDLTRVPGIGPKTLESMRDWLVAR